MLMRYNGSEWINITVALNLTTNPICRIIDTFAELVLAVPRECRPR